MHNSNNNIKIYNTNNNDFYYSITSHKFILRINIKENNLKIEFCSACLVFLMQRWSLTKKAWWRMYKNKFKGNFSVSFDVSHHVLLMQENVCGFAFVEHLSKICYNFRNFSEDLYCFRTGKSVVLVQDWVWFHEFGWICNSNVNNIVVIF